MIEFGVLLLCSTSFLSIRDCDTHYLICNIYLILYIYTSSFFLSWLRRLRCLCITISPRTDFHKQVQDNFLVYIYFTFILRPHRRNQGSTHENSSLRFSVCDDTFKESCVDQRTFFCYIPTYFQNVFLWFSETETVSN